MNVKEALGYSHDKTLDSSLNVIEAMLQEYAFLCNERNKAIKGDKEDYSEGEWITVPDFETGGSRRIRKEKDL